MRQHVAAALRLLHTAHDGAQPGVHFVEIDRFDQVVVGAQFEQADAVHQAATGRDHDHRKTGVAVADLGQTSLAAAPRQVQVEQHAVVFGRPHRPHEFGGGLDPVDGVARAQQ